MMLRADLPARALVRSQSAALCRGRDKLYRASRTAYPVSNGISRHDFGRIAVGPRPQTASPDGMAEDDIMTANGDAGATDADGGTPPVPARNCGVSSGPSYSPTGNIPVTTSGGKKKAHFDMSANFTTDAATGKVPACCQVRQFIKWDQAFHNWKGGPPHGGFPSSAAADTWIEDRDGSDNLRYGHRTGTHAVPFAGCGNQYKTGATQDMVNGDTYCGNDNPGGPDTMVGQFQFQLKVIDTCNGDAEKAANSVITVVWAPPTPAPAPPVSPPSPPAPGPAP